MAGITFSNGNSMAVNKIYEVKKENLGSVEKAIANPEDNSDYVIFQKSDKFFVASGKGDLTDFDKDIKLGIAEQIKFNLDGEDLTAIKVIDKPNTAKDFKKAFGSEYFNPGSAGIPAITAFVGMGIGSAIGDEVGAKIGAFVGGGIGTGILAGSYAIRKHSFTTIKSPDIDHLANQGVLKATN